MSYVQIHTSKITLANDVNLEEFVMTKDEFLGADIKAICTEAGFFLIRSFCLFSGMYNYLCYQIVTIWNCA
jgi:ATP-dependent 26S proteasome regulatory subunit